MKVDLDDTEFLSVLKYLQVKEFIVPKFAQDNSLESLDLTQKGVHYYDNKLEFWKQFALSKISDIIVSTITAILVTIITSYILHIS
ncbi:MAG: hypothetical protein HFJ51_07155 [Clostridia bacterium]|nr:hypothetical protein [Clostridia bacterium]